MGKRATARHIRLISGASALLLLFVVVEFGWAVPTLMPGWPWHTRCEPYRFAFALGPFDGLTYMRGNEPSGCFIPFGLADSTMYLLDVDGELMPGWPIRDDRGFIAGDHPLVSDLDGDGLEETIIVVNDRDHTPRTRYVHALNYLGEEPLGFPIEVQTLGSPDHFFYRPVFADLDSDDVPELLFTTYYDTIFYAYTADGQPYDDFHASIYPDSFLSSNVAVGDLDLDGGIDVVVGTTDHLFAFDRTGQVLSGWPVDMPMPKYVSDLTTPVLADIDRDGWLEVLVSTIDWENHTGSIEVYRYDGSIQPGWPFQLPYGWIDTSPVVGDIDNDGTLEIVVVGVDMEVPWSAMWAFEADGTLTPGWPIQAPNTYSMDPIIADVDGDRFPDIIVGAQMFQYDPDGDSSWSWYWAYDRQGNLLQGWPIQVLAPSGFCSPIVHDFDGNGSSNVLLASCGERGPYDQGQDSYIWLYELGIPFDSSSLQWPQAGHDRWNTSNYHFVEPVRTGISNYSVNHLPTSIQLLPAYPNPFNSTAVIRFQLPRAGLVQLAVFDLRGRKVATILDGFEQAGDNSVVWDASAFPSGIYFYRLTLGEFSATRMMTLLK